MLRTFIVATWRNLLKNRTYSFLNIFGLAMGIACAGLIFLWVEDEVSWDSFNVNKDRLYYVRENQKYDTYTATFSSTPGPLAPAMQAQIPGIAHTCRVIDYLAGGLFRVGDRAMFCSGDFVDSSIFDMFTLPFVDGNAKTALAQVHSIVLTEKTAIKFFGTTHNVVGRTVTFNNTQNFTVSAVLRDLPENSSLQFEFLKPFAVYYAEAPWAHGWGSNCLNTYVELQPGVNPAAVNRILGGFIERYDNSALVRPFLWSMNDWRLRDEFDNGKATGGGRITYVHLFTAIAWVILFMACINFMNLATARSEKRAREVGVRKVLGAGKRGLATQFLGEALFMALLAGILSLGLMTLSLPAFNELVQKNLTLGLGKPLHWAALLGVALICGLIAGSYPSLYLSSFNPVFILKGMKLKTGSAPLVRKALVVTQFTVSIALIICTIFIFLQIQHVKDRPLGFAKDHLLEVDVTGDMPKNYDVIRQALLGTGTMSDVALSDYEPIYGGNNGWGFTWDGKSPTSTVLISQRNVSPGFMKTYGLHIREGRDLEMADTFANKRGGIVITHSLEELMGKGSAVGKLIRYSGDTSSATMQVVGVVDDYVYGNMYGKSDPVMFSPTTPDNTNYLYVRIKAESDPHKVVSAIEGVLKKYNPAFPMQYRFVDDQFNQQFTSETLVSDLSRIFAALAIVISCLGLFGLASYTAERRTKEIGIRKVLGASVAGITSLITRDFLLLVLLSCLIAFPLSGWYMEHWLEGYSGYRIHLQAWVFAFAGLTALLIAAGTISFQAIRAALASPVKSLRTE